MEREGLEEWLSDGKGGAIWICDESGKYKRDKAAERRSVEKEMISPLFSLSKG